ncbi:MAG: HypC/HybG/HupF family hydrogenase formation chaperone [Bacteroidota bacterium]
MTTLTAPTDLSELGACTLDDDGCAVCGDNAVPVRVLAASGPGQVTVEDRTGTRAEVATAFTPSARPGDVLLVTAGVALSHLPAPEAAQP